eukprot:scaffold11571_cov119-Isochrysis_galbana.AAC.7
MTAPGLRRNHARVSVFLSCLRAARQSTPANPHAAACSSGAPESSSSRQMVWRHRHVIRRRLQEGHSSRRHSRSRRSSAPAPTARPAGDPRLGSPGRLGRPGDKAIRSRCEWAVMWP